MSVVFWLSLLLVGYTYAGYPVLLRALTGWKRRREIRRAEQEARVLARSKSKSPSGPAKPVAGAGGEIPPPPLPISVSVVLVVHNEAGRIAERIENLRQCDRSWPTEIIVVCDGCTDDTAARARACDSGHGALSPVIGVVSMGLFESARAASDVATLPDPGRGPVRVFEQESRLGKASGLNRGVSEARGDIIVFADARQRFNRYAILKLVAPFRDPAVAAVSGNLDIAASEQGTGAGIDAYWRLERYIRRLESEWDSVIGCTGAIYALRRSVYEPLPADTILDDVVIPMRALAGGHRVLFESEAMAFDPQELAPDREKRRKIRTLAGNYQMLFRYPAWLSPGKNRAWWQLLSHKYLRLAGPFFLVACLASSAWLARESLFYRILLGGQVFCYALALLGLMFRAIRSPLFTAPAGFLFLQWQGLRALFHYLRLRRSTESGAWS